MSREPGGGNLVKANHNATRSRDAPQNFTSWSRFDGLLRGGAHRRGDASRGTKTSQDADVAPRSAGGAHPAAVENQAEAERSPFVGWHERVERVLRLDRIGLG